MYNVDGYKLEGFKITYGKCSHLNVWLHRFIFCRPLPSRLHSIGLYKMHSVRIGRNQWIGTWPAKERNEVQEVMDKAKRNRSLFDFVYLMKKPHTHNWWNWSHQQLIIIITARMHSRDLKKKGKKKMPQQFLKYWQSLKNIPKFDFQSSYTRLESINETEILNGVQLYIIQPQIRLYYKQGKWWFCCEARSLYK